MATVALVCPTKQVYYKTARARVVSSSGEEILAVCSLGWSQAMLRNPLLAPTEEREPQHRYSCHQPSLFPKQTSELNENQNYGDHPAHL